ncbi:Long chain acyl-CoA synthetase 2 [Bienertia sinuspersici]
MAVYSVKVEEARAATESKPSVGAVYRCIYAEDGLTDVPDGVECPWDLFSKSVEKNPTHHMLGSRQIIDGKAGSYEWLTYKEVYDSALQIGSAIRKIGVIPGGQCGIYGSNCPKWIIAMQACNSQAISYVPLYDTLGANAVEFIINHAEVSLAFVQEKKIPAILACLSNHCQLENISSMHRKEAEEAGVSCFSWEEFSKLGTTDSQLPLKKKTDVCTIMYTSGTTGEPKGVILSNAAFAAEVFSIEYMFSKTDKSANTDDVYFSFLPLAHIFDQIVETYFISKGTTIGFWQGDVRYLIEDLQELKPTMFCGVPRIYDRLYTGIMDKITSSGSLRKGFKLRNLEKGLRIDEAAPLLDKFIFSKIKQSFGGRVRIMLSGGAPLARYVEEFLRVTCCSVVVQGYANVHSMMGTVGIPTTTIEARLESVPEMEYDALSSTPRGEICIRGNTLFSGYHKRQDLSQEVLIDGWFHTGDIGEWQPDGSMKVIDRKKNIFKLSQGEYVAVENLESIYSRCNLITSIWVYGNSFESFLVAVAVPERKALENWAADNHETGDFETLCKSAKARKYFQEELNSTGQKHKLRGFEMLRAVFLEPIPFDIERDLMTPTFKLKRPQLLKHYKEVIDEMYREAKGSKA